MDLLAGAIAATRFGMGARPEEIAAAASDPRGWLMGQLSAPPAFSGDGLMSTQEALAQVAEMRGDRRRMNNERRRENDREVESVPPRRQMSGDRPDFRAALAQEIHTRTLFAAGTSSSFHERLVRFWSNHFTVATTKPFLVPLVGAFEREAIRPHVTGRFVDMLLAVEQHPAMLIYLDNFVSVGPNSEAGRRRDRGINENLAREILELHTLGVDGGYSQGDVEEFARAITGWTVGLGVFRMREIGDFLFEPRIHEPGARTVVGKRYSQSGIEQGEAILRDLARHPSTARYIATKMAQHFIADEPPPAAVAELEKTFIDTDGDLAAMARAVVNLDAAWASDQVKFKTPEEFLISALRAVDYNDIEPRMLGGTFRALGQMPFDAPSPAGWPDEAAAWLGPDALMKRLEWAKQVGRRAPSGRPLLVLEHALGEMTSSMTQEAVARAESPEQGLTLALMSPEFQRR